MDDVLLAHLVAVDVLDDGHGAVQAIQVQKLIEHHAAAGGDVVDDDAVDNGVDIHALVHLQKFENQRFAHEFAVERLLEVAGSGILIHGHADFVDAGQRRA